MKSLRSGFVFLWLLLAACAEAHHCEKSALVRAHKLIQFHNDTSMDAEVDDSSLKQLKSIKNPLDGKPLIVIQVYGSIYKGSYRMRFTYYTGDGHLCALVGEEIFEMATFQ